MDQDEEGTTHVLRQIVCHLCQRLPDSKKSQQHLWKFAEKNDRFVYKLLLNMMDTSSDYLYILKHQKEAKKRISEIGGIGATWDIFLRRVCVTIVSKNSIPYLLKYVARLRESTDVDDSMYEDICTTIPAMYKSHAKQLILLLNDSNVETISDALEALAQLTRAFPDELPKDGRSKVMSVIRGLCVNGTMRQARNAARIFIFSKQVIECRSIIKEIISSLSNRSLDFPVLVSICSALHQFSKFLYEECMPYNSDLGEFLLQTLGKRASAERGGSYSYSHWTEFQSLSSEGKVKVLCIKILSKLILGSKTTENLFYSFLTFFQQVIDSDAENSNLADIQSHIRLQAAKALLNISANNDLAKWIPPLDVCKLSLIIQDPIYQVRQKITSKLCKMIQLRQVPNSYIALLSLIAHDPESDLKLMVNRFLGRLVKQQNSGSGEENLVVEQSFVRLLYILGHHPDFSDDLEDLNMFKTYIEFYLSAVATPSNVSYLYYSSGKIKMSRDANSESSTNLYQLSEMAQYIIQDFCATHNWALSTFEGSLKLPKDIFLVDKEVDLNVTYLPEKWLKTRSKSHGQKPSKDVLIELDGQNKADVDQSKQRDVKKRKAKLVAQEANENVRRNAARKARNVVVESKSDIENEY